MSTQAKTMIRLTAALSVGLVCGCVQPNPSEGLGAEQPPVVVVPSDTKTYAEFRQDDATCRQQAAAAPAAATPSAAAPSAPVAAAPAAAAPPERVYADCMVSRGNTLAPAQPPGSAFVEPGGPPAAYAAYAYAPAYFYDGPAFYGAYGDPFFGGFYGFGGFGYGYGYYPGRFYPGHHYGFYHGGGYRGGGGGFASGGRGGFSAGGHGRR